MFALMGVLMGFKPMRVPGVEFAGTVADIGNEVDGIEIGDDVCAGDHLLVYGASGSVGTFAVQIATHWGATVTAVSGAVNLELAGSLGADEVIDYTSGDFTLGEGRYDVIFDAVG